MSTRSYDTYPNPSKLAICSYCNKRITDEYRAAVTCSSSSTSTPGGQKVAEDSGWYSSIRGSVGYIFEFLCVCIVCVILSTNIFISNISGWMHMSCASSDDRNLKRKRKKRKRKSVSQITDQIKEIMKKRDNPPDHAKESKDWTKKCKIAANAVLIEVGRNNDSSSSISQKLIMIFSYKKM